MDLDFALFRRRINRWYERHKRDLPWRRTRDPYRVWISEIMLQQTRAAAVIPYYERFLERFPDAATLASADEERVLECWSGLGYYSRARNLHRAARIVAERGSFPCEYDSLRALPGIGDYTAAAIASIAFGRPCPVLDGNVIRVLSRMMRETGDIRLPSVRRRLRDAAERLLDRRNPGRFNQALMELGATVCLPAGPECDRCPVTEFCAARRAGSEHELPVKPRRAERERVRTTLLLIERNGSLLMWKRSAGRLAGFWDLPDSEQLPDAVPQRIVGSFRHSITRFDYVFTLVTARLTRLPSEFNWIDRDKLQNLPLAGAAKKALMLYS